MAPILHFDKIQKERSLVFVMTWSKREHDKVDKETKCLCPVIITGMRSDVNEETTISK